MKNRPAYMILFIFTFVFVYFLLDFVVKTYITHTPYSSPDMSSMTTVLIGASMLGLVIFSRGKTN